MSRTNSSTETHLKYRLFKDKLATWFVRAGGVSVIFAMLLIFVYLLKVVIPIFSASKIETTSEFSVDTRQNEVLLVALEERGDLAAHIYEDGSIHFIEASSGEVAYVKSLPLGDDINLIAVKQATASDRYVAVNEVGAMLVFTLDYAVQLSDTGESTLKPSIGFPASSDWWQITSTQTHIDDIDIRFGEDELLVTAIRKRSDNTTALWVRRFEQQTSFFDEDAVNFEPIAYWETVLSKPIVRVLTSERLDRLYAVNLDGSVTTYRADGSQFALIEQRQLVPGPVDVTAVTWLLGDLSFLLGTSEGTVYQVMPQYAAEKPFIVLREFDISDQPIDMLLTESRRKGFLALDADKTLHAVYSTSERVLFSEKLPHRPEFLSLSPRSKVLYALQKDGGASTYQIDNEHPEISFSVLWHKIWYEGYESPEFLWQSSASTTDFEPKFSLMPLSFGTLKAAFYAMLFAIPLGICGAIYTAYFLPSSLRKVIKPTIEIMEALPTVILGFLAGLWLAPIVEAHLPAVILILVLVPLSLFGFGYLWHRLPQSWTVHLPSGWQPVLLIPVIFCVVVLCFLINDPIEATFFMGDSRVWLTKVMGIDFDQRNALVVGFAMGFAVIPTIFSIAEDAIFSVPKHLINGSLALGASAWQTLARVVLPTASPGIFSSIMMGLGRAVGETMIVLMATGNTPIMDFNLFEGLRSLSANIAVEMPESEVGSTHYRVLFLTAFVLFIFTFLFNTGAEMIRHRLRKKYGSL